MCNYCYCGVIDQETHLVVLDVKCPLGDAHKSVTQDRCRVGLVCSVIFVQAIGSLLANIPGWEHIVEVISRENCKHEQKANIGELHLNKVIELIYLHFAEVSLPSSNVLYLKLRSNCFGSALGKPDMSILVLEKRMRFMERPALLMAASYILFSFINN